MTGPTSAVVATSEPPPHSELAEIASDLRPRITQMSAEMMIIAHGLLRAKRLLPHGNFGDWVEEELNIGRRTAERIMSVARRFEGKSDTVAHLPATVVYELAAPSTPQEVVDDVIAGRLEPKISAIRQARDRAKPTIPASFRVASRAVAALVQVLDLDGASVLLAEEILRYEGPEDLASQLRSVIVDAEHLVGGGSADAPVTFSPLWELLAAIAKAYVSSKNPADAQVAGDVHLT